MNIQKLRPFAQKLATVALLLMLTVFTVFIPNPRFIGDTALASSGATVYRTSPHKHWYDGGTLHKASADEWIRASYGNKLATCGDIVAGAWQKDLLKREIHDELDSMEDLKTLSKALVSAMDESMSAGGELGLNVPYAAAMIMTLADWLK